MLIMKTMLILSVVTTMDIGIKFHQISSVNKLTVESVLKGVTLSADLVS